MFPTFTPFTIQTEPSIHIHGLIGPVSPTKPPLLLLHGFPQTLHIWNKTAPALTSHYNVVLIDIRGYGQSTAARGADYSKTAMARDCVAVMQQHGFATFAVCGHDRGARIAHKLLVDHPRVVTKALLLDICPTRAMYAAADAAFAKAYHHWFWLVAPEPLPETMILGDPRRVLECLMGGKAGPVGLEKVFGVEPFERYVECARDEETVHAWCEDYRAAAEVDCEEQRRDAEEGRLIEAPIRVLWARHGVCEKMFDTLGEWRKVSRAEVSGEAVESGHYIPEEVPDVLLKHIHEFLV
ncbi:alpha/beta-hydrolase [Saccharata proteae CBS 121410]|uniref:Alpha/beta-hydrolase n=1 Tax=Saccharata proteae CBS 121410 TaxID=1314787 RepID=A0A6A5YDI7_9PEZI|nr:alpha/beta-hydrolase [Saccharata proteae CBS 121410]